ncbi:MAG: DUF445 family protein [Deltaproteobacteria bacterium]|nr:DUF445 family protein [Deltaproteobacteria bacterium]
MNTLLQLATPPLLGAFIGYTTNYVAIRMLFRPLHPWKILGLRVPMTPGVIPAKRHQLAENIGEMVGEHLLTGQDVSRAITGSRFQQELRELIQSRVENMLGRDLGPITTVIPERFRTYFQATVKIVRLRFITHMHAYLESDAFAGTIDKAVRNKLEPMLAGNLAGTFPRETSEQLAAFLEQTVTDLLASPGVKEWIASQLQQKIDATLSANRSLSDIIPPEFSALILTRLEQEAPGLLEKLAHLLQEPAMQAKIADTICTAISNFTASLGPMAAMLTSFISTETIRGKVNGYLDDKGEDIASWLADEAVQKKVARLLKDKADELLNTPLTILLKNVGRERINELNRDFSGKISELLAKPGTAASLTNILRDALAPHHERSVAGIITDIFGADALRKGQHWTATEVTAIFRSAKIKQLLDDLVVEMVEKKLLQKPIGPLTALLPRDVQISFMEYILQQVNDLLVKEVPRLVDLLHIRNIVTRKVDSLDLLRLEKLIMGIMQEQFKYINLFGGLLGCLIGLLNLLFL